MIEWAAWWGLTISNWENEGMPKGLNTQQLFDYFGLDQHHQYWPSVRSAGFPGPVGHGAPILYNEGDYEGLKGMLYSEESISLIPTVLLSR